MEFGSWLLGHVWTLVVLMLILAVAWLTPLFVELRDTGMVGLWGSALVLAGIILATSDVVLVGVLITVLGMALLILAARSYLKSVEEEAAAREGKRGRH